MKDTKIFLLAGKARTGKDTVASEIVKYYENKQKKVVRLGFSDYIKGYAMKISAWNGEDETKPRDLFVYSYFFDVIVISGARFPNELDIPKNKFKNVTIIKMERPNYQNNLTEKQKKHITEHSLEDYQNYDYLLVNNENIEELQNKTKKILEEVEK